MNRTLTGNGQPPGRGPSPASPPLPELYAPIAAALVEVEQRLTREMRSAHAFVDELLRYGCLLGGKRMRPALVLLSGRAVGELNQDHTTLATVVEMIHTATLVHDDVLDQASVRRRLATVNARWDNESSILLGDFLFSHAFYLAATLDSTWACQRIGRATNIVVEGELRQKGSRGNYDLTEQEYLSILNGKTAELCACSCHLGATAAGADPPLAASLEKFGRDLGIAFQIADDLLDVEGAEQTVGKSLGTDFEQRLPTLPLIHALRSLPSEEKAPWIERLSDPSMNPRELGALLARCDSIAYARGVAERFSKDARGQLDDLPNEPAVEALRVMADFAVARSA